MGTHRTSSRGILHICSLCVVMGAAGLAGAQEARSGSWYSESDAAYTPNGTVEHVATAGGVEASVDTIKAYEPAQPVDVHPDFERDGLGYPVSRFVFEYALPHEDLPDLSVYEDVRVALTRTPEGWIGRLAGVPAEVIRLGDVPAMGEQVFYGSAIASVNEAVRSHLELNYGMIGHLVTPAIDEIDFENTRDDLRPGKQGALTVQVWRAAVGELRSIGYGQKWDQYRNLDSEDEDHPEGGVLNAEAHGRVRNLSPVQPGALLTKPEIDRWVYHLNRHPGRRVDISMTPSGQPGDVGLDYMLTEAKDWAVYGQVSNTGTASTDPWVYRIGYYNNQLTDQDDILSIDYITAGFDASHTIMGSYSRRLRDDGRLRGRVFGRWNEYTASDVGFGFDTFKGNGYELGGELEWNFWQRGPRFMDLIAGARYEHIDVNNTLSGIEGNDSFLIPYVGLHAERNTPLKSFFGDLTLDFGFGMDGSDAFRLGRFGVEEDWIALRGNASYSLFLEPLLDPKGFKGEKTPDDMTLAHELYFSLRGQYAFGNRLVPNYQNTAGGFYTVRGYEESTAVGDDAIIATAEYRYHLGRAMPQTNELRSLMGRPFRSARTEPYGSADWNFIVRGFIDAARVMNNDRDPLSETDATLVGIGIGGELHIKNNITVRLDYGYALTDVGEGVLKRADSGDSRLHFMAQLLY